MKGFIALSILFLTLSCQDAKEYTKNAHPAAAHYENVGHQIPHEVGARWIEVYNKRNNSQHRMGSDASLYSINGLLVRLMLASLPNLTGVAFQYGIDGNGSQHIIAIPVDESLRLWTSVSGRIYIDANTGSTISRNVAREWANNYQDTNPDGIWFHYFGKNVFDEISSIPFFSTLDIIPAVNDQDLSPQLLLIIENKDLLLTGRINSQENTAVYDASYPCPRCEVQ